MFLKHLISIALTFLSSSAVSVQDSHAYRNMERTNERISLILVLKARFLSLHTVFSLFSDDVVWAILDNNSGLDPSSDTMAPKYLKLSTVF